MKRFLKYLSLGLLSTLLTAKPGLSAERISLFYPPFGEFSLPVNSLETFAKEGKIDNDFQFYAQRLTPEQLTQLREFLQQRFNVTPTLISQVTYSPIGEQVLQRLGDIVQTDSRQNGFYALRGALLVSASQPQGVSVINVLRNFPSTNVRLNFSEGVRIFNDLAQFTRIRDKVFASLQQQSLAEVIVTDQNVSQLPDLRSPGKFRWQIASFNLNDRQRDRRLPVDLYIPQTTQDTQGQPPFPLIVISHGIASDRYSFIYLAEHLASYGFAVAVLEHPGSNAKRFEQYFAGLAGPPQPREFIDRPLDIKLLLDELQRLAQSDSRLGGKLNFQQVGAIGQSFGGYTVLSLGGAKINFAQLNQDCNPENSGLNVSILLQCEANQLPPQNYQLQDSRIKAVIAINPISSAVFGENGINQVKLPVMIVAGSQDIFAPPVPEQIRPFSWLPNPNKDLVLIENATHFTLIGDSPRGNNVLPVPSGLLGPERTPAYSYLNALSVAFLSANLLNRPEYRAYLQPSYTQSISQPPLNLSILQSLSSEQLTKIVGSR
ncbi:alpha/beta hydrolase [Anabaena azotica]|uniref:Alpha/beta hydrolase n=1 Tax=Anabaena azotica FACHB-119 TaxID=947527 RepID=A0ABR8CZ87_9NOST|nr:alpha/beta hydrolase [Anabaena azotica]MBD2499977.1 alpha/beta hydrolase [Anabaena azotica FACHB-119]